MRTENEKLIILSICKSKRVTFLKEQEAKGLLSISIKVKAPVFFFKKYQMNAVVNKLLVLGATFMPEMYLKTA